MPSLVFQAINGPGAGPGRSKRRKLRGAKKAAFVRRMAAGRARAHRKTHRRHRNPNVVHQMPAVKRPAAKRAYATTTMPRVNRRRKASASRRTKRRALTKRYGRPAVKRGVVYRTKKRRAAKRFNPASAIQKYLSQFGAKKNPKRASGAKRKKTMAKRGKLKGKKKAAFLRRMAAGRRKKHGGGARKVRRHRKSRAHKGGARRVIRRRRRKNPGDITTAPKHATRRRRKSRKGRHVSRRRRSGAYRSLTNKIHRLEAGLKRKGRKRGRRGTPARARLGVLRLRRRKVFPGVSAKARHYMKLHGLNQVNPSMAGFYAGLKSLPGVLGEVAVAVASTGLFAAGASKFGDKVVAKMGASYAPWIAPVLSAAWGVLGFLGLRMTKLSAYSVPVLIGGVSGAAINLLAENHVAADGSNPAMSWGRALALPIGAVIYRGETANQSMRLGMGEVIQRGSTANQSLSLGMGAVIQRAETLNKPIRLGDLDHILAMNGIGGVDGVDGLNLVNDTKTGF